MDSADRIEARCDSCDQPLIDGGVDWYCDTPGCKNEHTLTNAIRLALDALSTPPIEKSGLAGEITSYLAGGGLFNPELANHEAVRDLLIRCRDALTADKARDEALWDRDTLREIQKHLDQAYGGLPGYFRARINTLRSWVELALKEYSQ